MMGKKIKIIGGEVEEDSSIIVSTGEHDFKGYFTIILEDGRVFEVSASASWEGSAVLDFDKIKKQGDDK